MYESTLRLRIVRVLAMVFWPVAILLGLTKFYPEMGWARMTMIAVGATWLVDQVGSFAMFCRGKPLDYRAERIFIVLNLSATSLSWICLHWNLHMMFPFWKIWAVTGGVAALCASTMLDDIYDTVRNHPYIDWSKLHIVGKFCKKKPCRSWEVPVQKDDCVVSYPCTPPPFAVEFIPEVIYATDIQKEVSKSMSEFLEEGRVVSLEATIPTRRQICELDDLIRQMRTSVLDAHMDDPTIQMPEELTEPLANVVAGSVSPVTDPAVNADVTGPDPVSDIAEEISASLSAGLGGGPSVQADLSDGLEFGFDPEEDNEWPSAAADENPFLAKRHPDLAVMRKKYSKLQNRLSVFLGGALGILGVRFEAMVVKPLSRTDSLQTALLVAILMVVAGLVLKTYVCYIVPKERIEGWMVVTVSIALGVGILSYGAQRFGLCEWVELRQFDISLYQLDVLLALCALLTIYYMVRGIWYHRCCAEAMAAAMNDVEDLAAQVTENTETEPAEVAVNDEQKIMPKDSSLSARWWWGRKRRAELASNASRAA